MKKLSLFLMFVVVGLLFSSGIALAVPGPVTWVIQYNNNTGGSANDLHVEVFKDQGLTQPEMVWSPSAIDPANWTGSVSGAGNYITYEGGDTIPAGGSIQVSFESSETTGALYTRSTWSYNGTIVASSTVNDAHIGNEIMAEVTSTIEISKPDQVDFGMVRGGNDYTETETGYLLSNMPWDLYAGIEDVPGYMSLIGSLRMRADAQGAGNLPGPIVPLNAAKTVYSLLANQGPSDGTLSIWYFLNLPGTAPPGEYRAVVTLNAVQQL